MENFAVHHPVLYLPCIYSSFPLRADKKKKKLDMRSGASSKLWLLQLWPSAPYSSVYPLWRAASPATSSLTSPYALPRQLFLSAALQLIRARRRPPLPGLSCCTCSCSSSSSFTCGPACWPSASAALFSPRAARSRPRTSSLPPRRCVLAFTPRGVCLSQSTAGPRGADPDRGRDCRGLRGAAAVADRVRDADRDGRLVWTHRAAFRRPARVHSGLRLFVFFFFFLFSSISLSAHLSPSSYHSLFSMREA